jgi:hypothetical protein
MQRCDGCTVKSVLAAVTVQHVQLGFSTGRPNDSDTATGRAGQRPTGTYRGHRLRVLCRMTRKGSRSTWLTPSTVT